MSEVAFLLHPPGSIVPVDPVRHADQLTAHFTLGEYNVSAKYPALARGVPKSHRAAVKRHAVEIAQPWRDVIGPIRHTSGYRSPALNDALRGSNTSQHLQGEAADSVPRRVTLLRAWIALWQLAAIGHVTMGQAIFYPTDGFIHTASPSERYPTPTFCVRSPGLFAGYPICATWADFQRLVPGARAIPDILSVKALDTFRDRLHAPVEPTA